MKMVEPQYPADARRRGIWGKTTIEAVIDKTGKPKNIKIIQGDSILAGSAVNAIKKWRWKPFKLNGVAVEVETTIFVNFDHPNDF